MCTFEAIIRILVLLLVLLCIQCRFEADNNMNVASSNDVEGSCELIPADSKSRYLCGRVVTYPYYLRKNQTLEELDSFAVSHFPVSKSGLLPSSCAVSILRVVCAMVFKKCSSSLVIGNISTWNHAVYEELSVVYPVPFQRPCRSVCTSISRQCMGWWRLFSGSAIDCSQRVDYSDGQLPSPFPLAFDVSDDEAKCNAIATNVSLSDSLEPYIGSVCSAFYSESIVVPSGSQLGLSYRQPPFMIQSLLESEILGIMQSVKLFLTPACRTSLLRMMCASVFQVPSGQTVSALVSSESVVVVSGMAQFVESIGLQLSDVLAYKFYEPALPVVDVCLAYYAQCPIYPALKSNISLLTPDCLRRPSLGIENMSTVNVVHAVSEFDVVGGAVWASNSTTVAMRRVPLYWDAIGAQISRQVLYLVTKSEPNVYDEQVMLAYEPICPSGFVVPEHPTNPGILWVEGTACAFSCFRAPIVPNEVWDYLYSFRIALLAIVGLLFLALLFYFFAIDLQRHLLAVYFACVSAALDVVVLISYGINKRKEGSAFCADNATPYSAHVPGNSFCTFQSIANTYLLISVCCCWMIIALDLYARVVRNQKTEHLLRWYFALVSLSPLPSVIYLLGSENYGYSFESPFACMEKLNWNQPQNQIYFVHVPIALCILVGTLAMLPVFFKFLSIRKETKWYLFITPITFWVLFAMFSGLSVVIKLRYAAIRPWYRNKVHTFVECVFSHFDGSTASWTEACGSPVGKISTRILTDLMKATLLALTGQALIIAIIYIPYYIYVSFFVQDHKFVNLNFSSRGYHAMSSITFSGLQNNIDENYTTYFFNLVAFPYRFLNCCMSTRYRYSSRRSRVAVGAEDQVNEHFSELEI